MKLSMLCLIMLCTLLACGHAADPTIIEIATQSKFNTLVAALKAGGDLFPLLSGPGPFTVFAPTDEAFAALPDELSVTKLLLPENQDKLVNILKYHVVSGKFLSSNLTDGETVPTLDETSSGTFKDVTVSLNPTRINDADVTTPDLMASNGVVHVINKVLIPLPSIIEIASGNSNFKTLVSALTTGGLLPVLGGKGPFTVFAPTDAAFAALPDELSVTKLLLPENKDKLINILKYHVVSGKFLSSDLTDGETVPTLDDNKTVTVSLNPTRINNADVTTPNLMASNGVVHVINKVLIPPLPSIIDIASGKDFTILAGALKVVGLLTVLGGEGPFTVFAPTNAAFLAFNKANPDLNVDKLALQNKDQLINILKYHVVSGKFLSSNFSEGQKVHTLDDNKTVTVSLNPTRINDAKVTLANQMASNGVVHVIDMVLMPDDDGSDDSLYWLLLLLLLPVICGAVMLCRRRTRRPAEGIEAPVAVSTPDPYENYVETVSHPYPTPTGSLV